MVHKLEIKDYNEKLVMNYAIVWCMNLLVTENLFM